MISNAGPTASCVSSQCGPCGLLCRGSCLAPSYCPSHHMLQDDPTLTSPKLCHFILCPCIWDPMFIVPGPSVSNSIINIQHRGSWPCFNGSENLQSVCNCNSNCNSIFFSFETIKYIHAKVSICQLYQVLKLDHNFPKESEGP